MSLEKDLQDFYSEEISSVVEDSEKFRRKLNIGFDAFKYLSNAENLGSFITTLSTGVGAASLTYFGWMASIGTLGKFGLLIGVMSTPAGWRAAAGAARQPIPPPTGQYATVRCAIGARRPAGRSAAPQHPPPPQVSHANATHH